MCNLYRIRSNSEPDALIALVGAHGQGLLWPEEWVMPFTRPLMPLLLDPGRRAVLGSWTLMPNWVKADDEAAIKKQSRMTANARCETLFELASFREAARLRRCLVLATEFREWQWQDPKGRVKIPHDIGLADGRPFLMAGVYSEWKGTLTFTIVTKPANALMTKIHNGARAHTGVPDPRMPVLVPLDRADLWLTPGPREAVEDLFVPRDDDGLQAIPERDPEAFDF